jgi:hypothetical protein
VKCGVAVDQLLYYSRVGMRRLTSIWDLMLDGPAIVTSELELDDDIVYVWLV